MGMWRVSVVDTGDDETGWPYIYDDDRDCGIIHANGFKQPYWQTGLTPKEARNLLEEICRLKNSGQLTNKYP